VPCNFSGCLKAQKLVNIPQYSSCFLNHFFTNSQPAYNLRNIPCNYKYAYFSNLLRGSANPFGWESLSANLRAILTQGGLDNPLSRKSWFNSRIPGYTLIAHTANDILTSLTGVYPNNHGVPIANSFRYFNPNGTSNPGVSFAYWNGSIFDPSTTTPTDTTYNMLTANGLNAPAPWVPYTRAGCNVGSVATANTVLENINVDVSRVYGATSPYNASY
jgi:hypothetical protein